MGEKKKPRVKYIVIQILQVPIRADSEVTAKVPQKVA